MELNEKTKKTPSYKNNKELYDLTYIKFLKRADSVYNTYECFKLINQLMLSLNDNHSKLYGSENGATTEILGNAEKFKAFKNTELYNTYPKLNINLDSLQTLLKSKPKEAVEGIYKKNGVNIGVVKDGAKEEYIAVILDSDSILWQKGELIYTLIPFGNNYYLAVGGSISSKRLIAYSEKIDNGFFHYMGFQKDENQLNYTVKLLSEDTYFRKEVSDNVTYIKIGSFNSFYPTLSNAETFYDELKSNLKKENLIVDLRNNAGGGERNSNILYKIIKEYSKDHKISVLVNHRTTSNAEQFAHRLSQLENTTLFGMQTNGTLAYEIENSSEKLPCNNFIAVLTSKEHKPYLKFESKGIEPDIHLVLDSDWIDQVLRHIEEND